MEVRTGCIHNFRNIRFVLVLLVCCECDDFTTDKKCSDICNGNHDFCVIPDICSTTIQMSNGQLYEKTSCIDKSQCITESENTFNFLDSCDGLQRNKFSNGDMCRYCCQGRTKYHGDIHCVDNRTFSRHDHEMLKADYQANLPTSTAATPSTTVAITTADIASEPPTTTLQTSTSTIDQNHVTCESCYTSDNCVTKPCSDEETYCLNLVEIDENGNMTVLRKGCANYLECKFDHSSQGCLHSEGKGSGYKTCEFCCKATNNTEPCNKNAKPSNIQWFGDTTPTISTTESTSTSSLTSTQSTFTTTEGASATSSTLSQSSTTSQNVPESTTMSHSSTKDMTSSSTTEIKSSDQSTSSSIVAMSSTMETTLSVSSTIIDITSMESSTKFSTEEKTSSTATSYESSSAIATSESTSASELTTSSDLDTPSTADVTSTSTIKTTTHGNIILTKAPPTTMAPHSTSTAIKTTTKKQPFTLGPKTTVCETCSVSVELCDVLHEPTNCEPPFNYCINKIINKRNGDREINRSCGNFTMCYKDWFLGSSDNDKCRGYDENNIVTLDFSCTFCCVTDGCNAKIRPDDNSLYTTV
ncbi:hypothetical protein ACF0H5_022147 [Mactra antiquata]